MSLTYASHDSLPYIDRPLTPTTTARIHSLIAAELAPSHLTTTHPSLPDLPEPAFSPLALQEQSRISSDPPVPLAAIDTARYDSSSPSLLSAYTATTHLTNRVTNLSLLSKFGVNSWLIGNAQLEEILKELEKELAETKEVTDGVNRERKRAQVEVKGELEGLEKRWREGVGRVIEVEVAGEMVFREILERRRNGN